MTSPEPAQGTGAASPSPPVATDPGLLAALREDLAEAGYDVDRIAGLLGERASAALHRELPLPADRVTAAVLEDAVEAEGEPAAGGRALAVLVRCFALGLAVTTGKLDAALPRIGSAGLLTLGMIEPATCEETGETDDLPPAESRVRTTCDLRPHGDEDHTWWVASDLSEVATGEPLPTDHVLGIGGASTTLASWTPRRPVERALDLGTGSGVQALHLSGHTAYPVVATDLSTRALAFATFTAALNGIELDLRHGSLLDPVAGEGFDLIVSNPPFVITPRGGVVPRYEYRDGGAGGDALLAGLVRDLAAQLRPGGVAQVLANWELREGEDWGEHVGAWLEGTGLDAWVVQREVQDAAEYAETWVRDGGHQSRTPAFGELYAAWLDDFAARGIERVGFGVVTLQRPGTEREPWRDLVDVPHQVASPMGPTVLRGLEARTWLAEHTADELLDTAWQVADDVTEERVGRPGAPDPQVIALRQGGGLRRTVRLDTLGAGLVGACDGELTARQLCSGLAVLTDTDPGRVEERVIPLLRDLVADGLLRRSRPGPPSATQL